MITRRSFLYGSTLSVLGAALPVFQAKADHNGHLISGSPAGSFGTTLAERLLPIFTEQAHLDYALEIISDGNTRLASKTVKESKPDGATILQAVSASMCLLPNVYQDIEYDPIADFSPLALMGDYTYALAVGPLVPPSVRTVDNYLDWVSDNPDFRDIGITLYGSQGHLAGLMLARHKEIALRMQAYSHTGAVITDMLNKELAATIFVSGRVTSRRSEGQLRALAVTSRERLQAWPQIKTFTEQGVDMNINGWIGWFAPANLSASTTRSLLARIYRMQQSPDYIDLQKRQLLTQVSLEPHQIAQRINDEKAYYSKLISDYKVSRIERNT